MDKQQEFALRTVEERDVRFIRLWFTDVLGTLKSVAIAPAELEAAFEEGLGFDGSAIEGMTRVSEDDMIVQPDPSTFQILPWRGGPQGTARMFCDILTPDGEPSLGDPRHVLKRTLAKAKDKGILVKEVDRTKLDYVSGNENHQGIVAFAAVREYSTVDDILAYAAEKDEPPFIVILDEIEDPHNLGAIIRTAECAGVHGVIIPKRRSVGLSYTVGKASAGAIEYMRVARVTNIAALIDDLKSKGVWVYGADMNGTDYQKCNFSGACAIVIGNEGKGISRLVREKCDVIVSLPMKGQINSLNASVAAGIIMYSAMKDR